MRLFGRFPGVVAAIVLALVAYMMLPCVAAVGTVRGLQDIAQDKLQGEEARGQEDQDSMPLSATPSVRKYMSDHPVVPIVLAVVVFVGLLIGVIFGRHTCKPDVSNDKMIISNQYMSCTILGVMTLTPSILLMVIGATVTTGSEKAGAGMFLGGFILAILALVWLGPNSYQMDVANGHVMIIRRHCIMFPRIQTYDVEDIRGFFLQMSVNQGRTMYQLFMELMTGRIVPMELTRSDANLRERQEQCYHMNEMLLESRRTHFGYGALADPKGIFGGSGPRFGGGEALADDNSLAQGLLGSGSEISDSGSSYSGSSYSSHTSRSSAPRGIAQAIDVVSEVKRVGGSASGING